jgi:hypothetical protein
VIVNSVFSAAAALKAMNWYRERPVYIPLLNEAARTALRLKFQADKIRVRQYCKGREDEIEDWFLGLKMFFGFSSFRGGTVFLSNLLKIELPDSHIEHEANLDDYWSLPKVMMNENEGLNYVRDFRRNEIFFRSRHDIKIYGEVNPMIRLHCKAFREVFPQAKLFHMVRDPRDVVRSIMSRENQGKKDPMKTLIKPAPTDPYYDRWPEMSRFERVCWEWQHNNCWIREQVPHCTRFEQMITDYDYFKEKLVDYLEIEISEETWARYVNKPRNISKKHKMSHWKHWDQDLITVLGEICGEEMSNYGYQI